jgi:hypothetical protein
MSTQTTGPACNTTARINAATTVHLLDGLYTAAADTTVRRCRRLPVEGRLIRST